MKHHLNDSLLIAYSAGQLPEAFGLVAATHLSLCDDCRARLGAHDAVGGAVLEACVPVQMAPGSMECAIGRIVLDPPSVPRPTAAGRSVPAPLADYLGCDLASVKWRAVGMGVRQYVLPTAADASVRLLYIPAGVAVPDHGHRGMELTLVLQGAFRDQTDRFGPGDIEIADQNMLHTPVAEPGQPCICLAATDAPLRFSGLIPRLAQTLFRL